MEKYRIPLFSLNYGEEEQAAVMEPLKNNWISMGPKNVELEKAFQEITPIPPTRREIAATKDTNNVI